MNRNLMRMFAALIISCPIVPQLGAQETATPPHEFEVASVKPNLTGGHNVRIQIAPGGRFVAENVTPKMLIQQAYGVKDFQIVDAPGWVNSEHYDINAKAEGVTGPEQLRPLLQALLAERFKVQIHRDTKELPIYALVVGKNGPKLKESAPSSDNGSAPAGPAGPPGPVVRGGGKGAQIRMGRGLINAQQTSMAMFVNQLSQQLGRSVTDKTGLTGQYDIKLEWTPEETPGPREGGTEAAAPIDSSGPTIFTALQEQLGLKLEGQKGPVEIIVIDHIEKATEN